MPVPDSGVPREWVDEAREAIRENRCPSSTGPTGSGTSPAVSFAVAVAVTPYDQQHLVPRQ